MPDSQSRFIKLSERTEAVSLSSVLCSPRLVFRRRPQLFACRARFFAAGLSSSLAVLGFSLPLCKKVELVTQNRTFEYRHIKKVKLVIRFYYYQSSINCKSPVHRGKPLFRSSPTQLFSKRASRICRFASPTPLFCRKAYDLLVSVHQTSTLPFTSRCLKLRI